MSAGLRAAIIAVLELPPVHGTSVHYTVAGFTRCVTSSNKTNQNYIFNVPVSTDTQNHWYITTINPSTHTHNLT